MPDVLKDYESLILRSTIIVAQQRDLTRRIEELELAQRKFLNDLRDELRARAA
jgi:hypothetical protein